MKEGSAIKFNLGSENNIRQLARRGYELAKNLKTVGIRFSRVTPASSDESIKKQFNKIKNISDLCCIEINITDKSDIDVDVMIEDVLDQLLQLETVKFIDKGICIHNKNYKVYRFIVEIYESSEPSE